MHSACASVFKQQLGLSPSAISRDPRSTWQTNNGRRIAVRLDCPKHRPRKCAHRRPATTRPNASSERLSSDRHFPIVEINRRLNFAPRLHRDERIVDGRQ